MGNVVKVLAVDDESYMLKILEACLSGPAFELTTCADAMQAMQIFKKSAFDIILLDIVMPGIDGFELHTLIRGANAEVPIIMLTAKVDDIDGTMLNRISNDKNTYYQNKTFKKLDLIQRVEEIVGSVKSEQAKKNYFEEMVNDLKLAGEVQRAILPNWDIISGDMRCSFYYRPCMNITGDVFTEMQISPGVAMTLMGDISGHGIQAALCMSAIEYFLVNFVRNHDASQIKPHIVLNRLHEFLSGIITDRYMTCLLSIIDFNKNEISYHNAGHPEYIAFSPSSGGLINLNPANKGSLPVALIPDTVYKEENTITTNFPPDTIFFAYTDGLSDLQNDKGMTCTSKLFEDFVETFAKDGMSPSMVFKIIDALFKLGYSEIKDDIALSVISRYKPLPNSFDDSIKPMIAEVDKFAQKASRIVIEQTKDEILGAKVEILASEFMNNVVAHGLDNKNSSHPIISTRMEFRENDILLSFWDKGKKWDMQAGHASDEQLSDILNCNRATSGRGLSIIKKISSSIRRIRYADTLNETIFTVPYKDTPHAQ